MSADWNWTFHIENNYPRKGWDYWNYCLTPSGWLVKDHPLERGQTYYSYRLNPSNKQIELRAETKKNIAGPKTLTIYIGCFPSNEPVVKSHTVTFEVKESDALFPNWHYYCNGEYMADSYYDSKSFEVFLTLNEEGNLEIVTKENTA